MLKTKKFSAKDDMVVLEAFEKYLVGDIIFGGRMEKTKAVSLWLSGKIKNVGVKTYSQTELESMTMQQLKKIGEPLGVTDRSKAKLIKELLVVL